MRKDSAKKVKITLGFVVLLALVIGSVIGLGILRFHAARLAYYLESVNQSIRKYSDEEVKLRQELSALVAPIRVYSYCKENLGMQKVLHAETIPVRIKTGTIAASTTSSPSGLKGWRSSLAWLLGR